MHHPFLEALGAALLHSLWQGTLVALVLYVVLRVIDVAHSALRYTMCGAALLLLFLLPISTTVQLYTSNQSSPSGIKSTSAVAYVMGDVGGSEVAISVGKDAVEGTAVPKTRADFRLAVYWGSIIVGLWLIGVLFFMLRWVNGFIKVQRLKRLGFVLDDPGIHDAFNTLVAQLHIKRKVRLLATLHVDQPMVIGWLKPVVLLPLSIATQLPVNQIEAILIHELVHVRRQDYLVLFAQSVMEVLFFFHPAVWWVSHQMRIEREYCCDDRATQVLGSDLLYVTALANVEQSRGNRFALGATGGKLVDRISRIVQRNEQRSDAVSSPWLNVGALMMVCGLFVTACLDFGKPNLEGTPDELYAEAVEKVAEHNYKAALPYAKKAAESGHMCSAKLLSDLYNTEVNPFTDEGVKFTPVKWPYRDNETAAQWAGVFVDALRREAEAGDSDAMVWLALGHRKNVHMGVYSSVLPKNDSLDALWTSRAVRANNPHAIRWKAKQKARRNEIEAADSLFARAFELGDEAAFWWWAQSPYGDSGLSPERYLGVLDKAIENQAAGTHEMVRDILETLDRQISLGNAESVSWRALADSLRFKERLEAVPEDPSFMPWPEFRTLCSWDRDWFYNSDQTTRSLQVR